MILASIHLGLGVTHLSYLSATFFELVHMFAVCYINIILLIDALSESMSMYYFVSEMVELVHQKHQAG